MLLPFQISTLSSKDIKWNVVGSNKSPVSHLGFLKYQEFTFLNLVRSFNLLILAYFSLKDLFIVGVANTLFSNSISFKLFPRSISPYVWSDSIQWPPWPFYFGTCWLRLLYWSCMCLFCQSMDYRLAPQYWPADANQA